MNFSEWIELAKNGDHFAFRQLVRALEPKVATTVIGMLGNCPEADDIGQEAFLRFYRALGKIREPEKCESFITRIAINLSLNELKKRKRRLSIFRRPSQNEEFESNKRNRNAGNKRIGAKRDTKIRHRISCGCRFEDS